MKKLFSLAIVALTLCSVACTKDQGAGSNAPKGPFAIYTNAPLYNAIPVTVQPADEEATYYYGVYEAATVDQFDTTDDFANALIASMKKTADAYGLSITYFLSKGQASKLFEGLSSETDHYVYAFGVNPDATLSTEVVLKPFKTAVRPELPAIEYFTYGYWENMGDRYEVGANTWMIDIYSDEPKEYVYLYFQTAADATSFVGEYTIENTGKPGTVVPGYFSNGSVGNSFIGQLNAQGQLTGAILLVGGTVVVEQEGENYKITIDAQTQDAISGAKDSIRIVYNAPLEEYVSSTSAMKFSASRPTNLVEITPLQ